MKNIGVYAGSFDPPTHGHVYVMKQASLLFDHLIVAIGVNPDKKCTFTLEERMDMLREITNGLGTAHSISVTSYINQLLARFVDELGMDAAFYSVPEMHYIVRGIRNPDDAKAELAMLRVNNDKSMVSTPIPHRYFPPPPELAHVSSSLVKGLCGPEGWQDVVKPLVPKCVFNKLVNWKLNH